MFLLLSGYTVKREASIEDSLIKMTEACALLKWLLLKVSNVKYITKMGKLVVLN